MNNSIPERFIFQCALFKNLEREVLMTHGYVDSQILSDLYLQILQYIEMHKTTLTDIIINDRESVLS